VGEEPRWDRASSWKGDSWVRYSVCERKGTKPCGRSRKSFWRVSTTIIGRRQLKKGINSATKGKRNKRPILGTDGFKGEYKPRLGAPIRYKRIDNQRTGAKKKGRTVEGKDGRRKTSPRIEVVAET